MEETHHLAGPRQDKLARLRSRGLDPFHATSYPRTHSAAEIKQHFDQLEGQTVAIAGRLRALRGHGKATFGDLQDASERIQVHFAQDRLGEDAYALLEDVDLGDFLGVTGRVFRTRRGEITVAADSYQILCKAFRPLPEKWHGLRDVELRYRQRYVDLIVNRPVYDIFLLRSRIVSAIRRFLDERGFIEVETPVLQSVAGGATARPFVTHHNTLDLDLCLRIAEELHLKRLIVGGFEKVYELNRCFRNEGVSARHNPEFTMLELYWAYVDYRAIMELVEQMVSEVAQQVLGRTVITYQGQEIELRPPWRRLSLRDAVREFAKADADRLYALDTARALCRELDLPHGEDLGLATMIDNLLERYVEPRLIQPTFLFDYPAAVSPLAKRKPDQPELAERFEPFIGGREVGNAFSELNDPVEQRQRFEAQVALRAAGDEEQPPIDEDFIRALEYGMPPTGGLGIGVDRLVMILADVPSIRDVILFPQLRPE